jgi:prevent-host-death family protein
MRVNAAEVEKDFGAFERKAREEPVEIERDGEPSVVLVSAEEWARLSYYRRRAIPVWELSEEELEAIRTAEIPPEHRWRSDDPE